jgi:hypothetical protein
MDQKINRVKSQYSFPAVQRGSLTTYYYCTVYSVIPIPKSGIMGCQLLNSSTPGLLLP